MKNDHTAKYEAAALELYARMSDSFNKARCLNMVCGVYLSGNMRRTFLENVFGAEMKQSVLSLTGDWDERYPALAEAAEELWEDFEII